MLSPKDVFDTGRLSPSRISSVLYLVIIFLCHLPDNWLKAFSDEPKVKKKKTKKKRDSSGPPAEDSMSVLNAAGFIGKKFSWASSSSGYCFYKIFLLAF